MTSRSLEISRCVRFVLLWLAVGACGCDRSPPHEAHPAPGPDTALREDAQQVSAAAPAASRRQQVPVESPSPVQTHPTPDGAPAGAPAGRPGIRRGGTNRNDPQQLESKNGQDGNPFSGPPTIRQADARRAGIRSLAGNHLTLYTDLPSATEVDSLPVVFDQAVPQWCRYFGIPDRQADSWRLVGYLMRDRQRFRNAGLLPDDLPPFLHGYQRQHEMWLYDQPSDYYRRHLLLHEGTHGFMMWMLGGVGPPWYAEGIAELLATHRWHKETLTLGHFPTRKEEVPQWGRIKIIKDEVSAGRGMTLAQILRYDARAHIRLEPYAWCWAAAAFLDGCPQFRTLFRTLPSQVCSAGDEFSRHVEQQLAGSQRELDDQWQLFIGTLEYGFDLQRAAIQFAPGNRLPAHGAEVTVAADRGWQSSQLRLEGGTPYRITARGRYQVANTPDIWWCEPGGVTLRYYRGFPIGMLLGTVRSDQGEAGPTPFVRPIGIGLDRTILPPQTGTLYLSINESAAALSDNAGDLTVKIVPVIDSSTTTPQAAEPPIDEPSFGTNN